MQKAHKPPRHWRPAPCEPPHTVTGDLRVFQRCLMRGLRRRRPVYAWLPPSYGRSDKRYPVMYMMDAQNLFDTQTSFAGVEWQVDESMQALAAEGIEAIVVAIHHAGSNRVAEYTPWATAGGYGEDFLRFLTDELKPRIDREFATLPDREHTIIAGSSMGGLISLYAFLSRPEVFGNAGVFSPALWVGNQAIYNTVRETPLVDGRLYVDCGVREPTVRPMVDLLRRKGYRDGSSLMYVREKGARHDEAAWARRFPAAARYLLGAGSD